MGTRNLQMAINKEGETKVAQYSQWDGYPEGQGAGILEFLRSLNGDYDTFNEKLNSVRFQTEEDEKEVQDFLDSIGASNGWMNSEQSDKWQEKYPELSRDTGSDIFQMIMDGNVKFLTDASEFGNHRGGLHCEWIYEIDLSTNELRVNGWGSEATFDLNNLPTKEEFIEGFTEEEQD